MAASSSPITGTLSISVTRWRQWSKAASEPIIDITASGTWASSGGGVGQPLHLAHHVVAEVAHQPAVQRGELGDRRRAVGGQHLVEGGQDAAIGRSTGPAGGRRPRPDRRAGSASPPGRARRTRTGSTAPRARRTRAGTPARRRPAWRRRRPGSPGRPAARTRPGRSCTRRPATGSRPYSAGSAPVPPKRPREARAGAGVAGAAPVLDDGEQQHVAVAVVVRRLHLLDVAAGVALAPHLLAAAAPVDHPPLVERHAQRVGVHPRQHQHGAVDVLGDRRHQPVGVERDRPELLGALPRCGVTGTDRSTLRCARRPRRAGRARAA